MTTHPTPVNRSIKFCYMTSLTKKLMAEIDSLKVVELNRLEKGSPYQIRTKAKLRKLTLPFHLHHVLFFLALWDFDTDWYTIDFIY